jgi:serine protease inhibitor
MYFLIIVLSGICFLGSQGACAEKEANNDFTCELMGAMPKGNFCLSPFNIRSTCTIALFGAQGKTRDQMLDVLKYSASSSDQSLLTDFQESQKLSFPVLDSAYAVVTDSRFIVQPSFLELVKGTAELFPVDFAKPSSLNQINSWVASKTENKIEKLLEPGDIDSQTKMVLLGASFCKAKWRTVFDANHTHDAPFSNEDGSSVEVKMMTQDAVLEVFEGNRDTVVVLGCDLPLEAIVVQTPLRAKNISKEQVAEWRDKAKRRFVRLFLPKCTLHERLNLKETLSKLGMDEAFSTRADFSGIDAADSIKIDSVIHEALIEVKEEGIAAAAATAVSFGVKSYLPVIPERVIRIDQPFYLFLRHAESGVILFVAYVSNMKQG